jgi:hypothetical protein
MTMKFVANPCSKEPMMKRELLEINTFFRPIISASWPPYKQPMNPPRQKTDTTMDHSTWERSKEWRIADSGTLSTTELYPLWKDESTAPSVANNNVPVRGGLMIFLWRSAGIEDNGV